MRNFLTFTFIIFLSSSLYASDAEPIFTEYGNLTSENGNLFFNGNEVIYPVSYTESSAYSPIEQLKVGDSNVLLFQQANGNSCPGNYVFVTVSNQGAQATKNFGTCYDERGALTKSGDVIYFTMPNLGNTSKSTFTYLHGIVLKDGIPID